MTKKRVLLFQIFALILSLGMTVAATLAWIAQNRGTDSGGMRLSIDADNATATYVVYQYDIDENKAVIVPNGESIALNQYDQVFMERNKYTPLVIRVAIESARLVTSGSGSLNLVLSRTAKAGASADFYSSQVIRFTATTKEYAIVPDGDDYSAFYNAFNEDHYAGVFALSSSGNNFTVAGTTVASATYAADLAVTELTLSVPYSGSSVRVSGTGESEVKELTLFLYITYDRTALIAAINGSGTGKQEIDFVDDLRELRIDVP